MFRRCGLQIGFIAVLGGGVAPVASGSNPGVQLQLTLASMRPAAPTAMRLHVLYNNPADPSAKPSPLKKSVVRLPAGAAFDGQAIPACTASDNQLMTQGATACPTGSQVGAGTVSLITGCGAPVDPFLVNAELFNGGNGLIELFSQPNTGARLAVGHAYFTERGTLTETPAPQPGCPPDGQSAVHEVDFHFDQRTGPGGAGFISTPASCPASANWISQITATVSDGSVYTATSTTPCTAANPPAPRIVVRVTPGHIPAGKPARITIRLSSSSPGCIRQATVKVLGLRARSNNRGTTVLALPALHPGAYHLTASHNRCGSGHGWIIVSQHHTRTPRRTVSRLA